MRIFDLFLRRAGVDRATVPAVARRASSRLTVVCPRESLGAIRQQICLDFKAAGLDVSQMQVEQDDASQWAKACITVHCAADKRPVLMSQARALRLHPAVRDVRFADRRQHAV